jgi:hypothetical protein
MGNTNKIERKCEANTTEVKLYSVGSGYNAEITDRYDGMRGREMTGFQQNLDFTEMYKVRCEVSETVSQYPKSRLYLEFPEIDYNRTEEEPFNGIELDINYLYPDIQMQFELEL